MKDNGFEVVVENVQDMDMIKNRYKVPPELQSCHRAIVDGYIIEGHVPVREINRLLTERPDVVGLAVAGMPIGSPGMENTNAESEPFDVIAFDGDGQRDIFASYP